MERSSTETSAPRKRVRELGVVMGDFATGPHNAITDVAGVRVGHATIIEGESGELVVGEGPVRTGVTAILPNRDNVFMERLVAGAFVLNGAGEMSGVIQLLEWGMLETPILLTNTLSVGAASQAVVDYMVERYPGIGTEHDVIIPLVGECDDSHMNDIAGGHVAPEHVWAALDNAAAGPVEEGNVGGGTGMVSFDLKGGIGTSSRVLPEEQGGYTVGMLVMSNLGRLQDLRIDGMPVGRKLAPIFESMQKRKMFYGSIIAVLATDAPLNAHQINRLCKRVGLGIGRVGSYAAHGSGEIVVGFSTANVVPRDPGARTNHVLQLADRLMDPLYAATIEATEEAIVNAMCAAGPMEGVHGNFVPALPLEVVEEMWQELRVGPGLVGRNG